jgi:hypothetical protein
MRMAFEDVDVVIAPQSDAESKKGKIAALHP